MRAFEATQLALKIVPGMTGREVMKTEVMKTYVRVACALPRRFLAAPIIL